MNILQVKIDEFLIFNKKFWAKYKPSTNCKGILLVEPAYGLVLLHPNAVFAKVISRAKTLQIGWMKSDDDVFNKINLTYDEISKIIELETLSWASKIKVKILYKWSLLKIYLFNNIFDLYIGKMHIGDLLYDTYLYRAQRATVQQIDDQFKYFLYILIEYYFRIKKTIIKNNVLAVQVSDKVGFPSGILFRTALSMNVKVFETGQDVVNVYNSINEMHSDRTAPSKEDFNEFMKLSKYFLHDEFQNIINLRYQGKLTEKNFGDYNSYKEGWKMYDSKRDFNKQYKLNSNKKNVFVMINCFNDYPNAVLGKGLYNDYYHALIATIRVAKSNYKVNWIFKEHPANSYHPTKDLILKNLFDDQYDHIIFINKDEKLNSNSLIYVADVIVSGSGSAAYEFPAIAGIPAVLFANNHTSYSGFTYQPQNITEYESILINIQNLDKLTENQQFRAKLIYLFIHKYMHVDTAWIARLCFEDSVNPAITEVLMERISTLYKMNEELIYNQLVKYEKIISEENFKRLNGIPKVAYTPV